MYLIVEKRLDIESVVYINGVFSWTTDVQQDFGELHTNELQNGPFFQGRGAGGDTYSDSDQYSNVSRSLEGLLCFLL